MRIATIASVAVLGLSTAALASGVTSSPLQTTNNAMSMNDMAATPMDNMSMDNSTDTMAMPDNTVGNTTSNKM